MFEYHKLLIDTYINSPSFYIYWTGPLQGVNSPIQACALGGVCSLKTVNKNVNKGILWTSGDK